MCWLCTLFSLTAHILSATGSDTTFGAYQPTMVGPRVKVGSHHREREQWGGPRSSAPTLNYWVGLAVATCSTITTLPAKAHRHTSQSPIALSSKAHMNFDVFIRRRQLHLGLERYDKSTEDKKREDRDMPCWQLSYPSTPGQWDEFAEWFKSSEINLILNKFSLREVANSFGD